MNDSGTMTSCPPASANEKFADAGAGPEFLQRILLDLEFGETAGRHAARKRRRHAGIGIIGADADIREERDVDRYLNNQLDRLALYGMRNPNARERQVFALHLRDLGHFADLLRRRSGWRLALHDPVLVGRGGALRRFVLRRLHLVGMWNRNRRGPPRRQLCSRTAGNQQHQATDKQFRGRAKFDPPHPPFFHSSPPTTRDAPRQRFARLMENILQPVEWAGCRGGGRGRTGGVRTWPRHWDPGRRRLRHLRHRCHGDAAWASPRQRDRARQFLCGGRGLRRSPNRNGRLLRGECPDVWRRSVRRGKRRRRGHPGCFRVRGRSGRCLGDFQRARRYVDIIVRWTIAEKRSLRRGRHAHARPSSWLFLRPSRRKDRKA